MNNIALFYRKSAIKTGIAAEKIVAAFGEQIDVIDVETASIDDFTRYDFLILGVATWFEGELPTCWDELVTAFSETDFQGKRFAVFGLGDQVGYDDCFCDAVGIIAKIFMEAGAELVGTTSTDGYRFEQSMALNDEHCFYGLCLDFENQQERIDPLINAWVDEVRSAFLTEQTA